MWRTPPAVHSVDNFAVYRVLINYWYTHHKLHSVYQLPPMSLPYTFLGAIYSGEDQPPPNKGCYKCDRKKCVTCSVIKITKSFTCKNSGRTYNIRYQLGCRSSWIIYLIQCKALGCGKQYIGRSWKEMRSRHYGHRNQFKNSISFLATPNNVVYPPGGTQLCWRPGW